MKNQTAVEKLIEDLKYGDMAVFNEHHCQKYIDMEKEQHFKSYRCGNAFLADDSLDFKDYFEQYYKQTYEK